MTAERMQNTHEKAQLEWVKISKLFDKVVASISPHTNLTTTTKKKIKKLQKAKPNKYIKKYSIKVALKKSILKHKI